MLTQAAAPQLVVAGLADTQPSAGHRHVKQGSTGQRQAAMQVPCAALHTTAEPSQVPNADAGYHKCASNHNAPKGEAREREKAASLTLCTGPLPQHCSLSKAPALHNFSIDHERADCSTHSIAS